MPKFIYKAKQAPGKIVSGVIEAENVNAAIVLLDKRGLVPIDITESAKISKVGILKPAGFKFDFFQKIKLSDKVLFTRQLSDLVAASVPMLRSLEIVGRQTSNLSFKEVIEDIHRRVKDGSSFSAVLSIYPDIFSPLFVSMVKSGEIGGKLEQVLNSLADYLEKQNETRNKIKASLAYPVLIFIVGLLTIFVLLTFVIPRLSTMFDDLGQSLPLPTLILMSVGSFFEKFWWAMLTLFAGAFFYFRKWTATEVGKNFFNRWQLKVPLLGNFIKIAEAARFSRTLATLLENGVPVETALDFSSGVIQNSVLQGEMSEVSRNVRSGSSLKGALQNCSFFSETAVQMISVSEETGKLHQGLYRVAENFEKHSDQQSKLMTSLIGPLILICVVGVVGLFVIAMLLPIFQMNLLIQ